MNKQAAFVSDELCFWHDPGNYALMLKPGPWVEPYRHIENPDPKRRLLNLAQASGVLQHMAVLPARDATDEELLWLHTAEHVQRVKDVAAAGGGDVGMGAPMGAAGNACARRSAGAALTALDAVMSGQVQRAYALTRPPGHHAEPGQAMGFCIFANAALAAEAAIRRHGLKRVAIVDWDVHFGNGTQACFEARRDVLAISLHQQAGYLMVRGEADEIGSSAGAGYSINLPLPAGCGHGAYVQAFERCVLPALEAYKPELIVVACGYDAGRFDPLGRMLLDDVSFRWLTRAIIDVAARHAQGRLVFTHEGGYCPASVPFFGHAVLEELAGVATEVICPFTAQHAAVPGNALQDHQRVLIDALAQRFEAVRQRHWG